MSYQFYSESLSTHTNLTPEDIDWGSKTLSSLKLNNTQQAVSGLLLNKKTFSGRYARMYNLTADDIIKNRSVERLSKLVMMKFDNLYPELNDNPNLSLEDKGSARDIINTEYQATMVVINNPTRDNYMPYSKDKLPKTIVKTSNVSYNNAYNLICIQSDKYISDTNVVGGKINTIDPGSGNKYCFNKDDLLARFASGIYTNPKTGETLPNGVINFIEKQFDIELKLLKRPILLKSDEIPLISNQILDYQLNKSPSYMTIQTPMQNTPLPTLIGGKISKPTPLPNISNVKPSMTLPEIKTISSPLPSLSQTQQYSSPGKMSPIAISLSPQINKTTEGMMISQGSPMPELVNSSLSGIQNISTPQIDISSIQTSSPRISSIVSQSTPGNQSPLPSPPVSKPAFQPPLSSQLPPSSQPAFQLQPSSQPAFQPPPSSPSVPKPAFQPPPPSVPKPAFQPPPSLSQPTFQPPPPSVPKPAFQPPPPVSKPTFQPPPPSGSQSSQSAFNTKPLPPPTFQPPPPAFGRR